MRKLFICVIALSLIFFSPRITTAAIEDAIVAIVNDDIITINDLKDYLESIIAQQKMEGASPAQVQQLMVELEKNGLERLIEDKIVLNEANKKEIKASEDLIDRRIESIVSQYPSEEDFYKALVDEGISVTDIRNKIRDQLKIKIIVDQEIRANIYVSPLEVTQYFKNHFEDFQKQERVNLDSIFVPKKNDPRGAKAKIEEALAELKKGKDFSEVAKKYSQGKPVGVIRRGQTLPEIENRVFTLATGEFSGIIEVENGFYIFKLLGRKPKELAELDEVKGDIYNLIFQEKFQEKLHTWLEKLRKESFIDIKKH